MRRYEYARIFLSDLCHLVIQLCRHRCHRRRLAKSPLLSAPFYTFSTSFCAFSITITLSLSQSLSHLSRINLCLFDIYLALCSMRFFK